MRDGLLPQGGEQAQDEEVCHPGQALPRGRRRRRLNRGVQGPPPRPRHAFGQAPRTSPRRPVDKRARPSRRRAVPRKRRRFPGPRARAPCRPLDLGRPIRRAAQERAGGAKPPPSGAPPLSPPLSPPPAPPPAPPGDAPPAREPPAEGAADPSMSAGAAVNTEPKPLAPPQAAGP